MKRGIMENHVEMGKISKGFEKMSNQSHEIITTTNDSYQS